MSNIIFLVLLSLARGEEKKIVHHSSKSFLCLIRSIPGVDHKKIEDMKKKANCPVEAEEK